MLLSRWLPLISGVMRYFSLYSHTANLSSSRLHIRQEVCRGGGWSGALNLVQFGHAARSTFKHFKRHAVQQRCRGSRVLVSWLCRMKLGRKITNKSKLNVSVAALHLFGLTSWFGLGPVQTTVFVFFFRKRTRIASVWPTVHTDPETALFWKRVSGLRNSKTHPSRSHVYGESAYFP